jgi:predicted short-subunit dehydrogenase-like oxidoreductase (DUF2520 family)
MPRGVNISLIGTGKVAMHLAPALQQAGHHVIQIIGRNEVPAKDIAQVSDAAWSSDFSSLSPQAELVILAVSDSAIAEVSEKLPFGNFAIVHVSGATPIASLARFVNHGVLYFLQSFVPHKKPDFAQMPVLINGSNEVSLSLIRNVAESLSEKVSAVSDHQREAVHVAAVFANNFSNHMLTLAEDILRENNMNLDVLKPLIFESTERLRVANPSDIQTGPAIRGDEQTIKKHVELLNNAEKKDLYERISKSIQDRYREKL